MINKAFKSIKGFINDAKEIVSEKVSNVSVLSPENSVIAIFDSISSSLYSSLLFLLLDESLISP